MARRKKRKSTKKQKGKGLILKMPRRPMTRAFVANLPKPSRPIGAFVTKIAGRPTVEQEGGIFGTLAAALLSSAVGGLISEAIRKKKR